MKRKLLNGLLLATALVGVGTIQSCKDYESDFQNEWKQQNYTLEEEVALLKNRVGELERIQAQCQANCDRKIQEILNMIGYWDTANRGTITQNIKDILSRLNHLEDNSKNDQELTDFIYKILIERGWKAGADGKPAYVDIPGLQDRLLEACKELADMQVTVKELQKQIDYINGLDIENRLAYLENWVRNHTDSGSGLTEDQVREIARQEAAKAVDAYKLIVNQQLESLKQLLMTEINNLDNRVSDNTTNIKNLQTIMNGVTIQITNMQKEITQLGTRLSAAEENAINALNQANENAEAIRLLNELVEGLQGAVAAANERIDEVDEKASKNAEEISKLNDKLAELSEKLDTLQQQYDELDSKFTELAEKYNTLEGQVNTNTSNIQKILLQIENFATKEQLADLTTRVEANEAAIKALQGDVMTLFGIYNRLNKLVTGIIVQSVYNPLFGNFSLPIGIKNNMLVNFYGEYDGVQPLVFPSQTATTTRPMLTAEEVANLGSLIKPITIQNGEILMDGNMGKVYMTINPTNVALDGVQLTMESSNGTKSRVELQNVRRSSENLSFGYSRAENGFYEADAVLPLTAGAVNNTNLKLDENLKSSVKDVLNDRSKANVFNVLKAVYGTINQNLPAYALKTTWKADDGQGEKEYSVLSNYEIAAVTFRPLSYNTYAGQSINHKFNHHGPLKDVKEYLNKLIKNEKYHFTLDANVNTDNISVKFKLKEIEEINLEYNGTIYAKTSGLEFDIVDDNGQVIGHGKTGEVSIPVNGADLDDFLKQLSSQVKQQINEQLPIWDKQMEDEFKRAINQFADEVNNALKDLEVNINGQIDDILNNLKDDIAGKTQGIVDKLNKFLDKYNSAIDKINDFMADPNHYLQVAMVYYTGKGEFHRLSDDRNDPSILNPAGGNGVELIATSYSAEVAAPAYKKFVAISAAWDKSGKALSPAEIQALNGGSLCQVLTGRAKRVALPTSKMKSGYTYQIVYTAVDFHGYTSVERYYVRMK